MAAKTASRGASNRWLPWMLSPRARPPASAASTWSRCACIASAAASGSPARSAVDDAPRGRRSARSRVARVAPVRSRLTLPSVLMMRMNWASRKLPAASHTASWNSMSRVLNRSASSTRAAQLGEECLEARDLRRRDPLRGQPDVADLHDAPGLDHLGQRDRVLGEHEVQVRDQLLRLQGRDVGAGALADLDHVHDRERTEGLPQHGPADVHHGGQLALGRELVAGPQLSARIRSSRRSAISSGRVLRLTTANWGQAGPGSSIGRRGPSGPSVATAALDLPCCCHRRDARPI